MVVIRERGCVDGEMMGGGFYPSLFRDDPSRGPSMHKYR